MSYGLNVEMHKQVSKPVAIEFLKFILREWVEDLKSQASNGVTMW